MDESGNCACQSNVALHAFGNVSVKLWLSDTEGLDKAERRTISEEMLWV
jgi:hypothetical protein